jgi:hypothetical protein
MEHAGTAGFAAFPTACCCARRRLHGGCAPLVAQEGWLADVRLHSLLPLAEPLFEAFLSWAELSLNGKGRLPSQHVRQRVSLKLNNLVAGRWLTIRLGQP